MFEFVYVFSSVPFVSHSMSLYMSLYLRAYMPYFVWLSVVAFPSVSIFLFLLDFMPDHAFACVSDYFVL